MASNAENVSIWWRHHVMRSLAILDLWGGLPWENVLDIIIIPGKLERFIYKFVVIIVIAPVRLCARLSAVTVIIKYIYIYIYTKPTQKVSQTQAWQTGSQNTPTCGWYANEAHVRNSGNDFLKDWRILGMIYMRTEDQADIPYMPRKHSCNTWGRTCIHGGNMTFIILV